LTPTFPDGPCFCEALGLPDSGFGLFSCGPGDHQIAKFNIKAWSDPIIGRRKRLRTGHSFFVVLGAVFPTRKAPRQMIPTPIH
jgi:hypothetical protein